jgi:hypothetical protein
MVLRVDYLVRMIQRAAEALARAFSRKQEGRHADALAEIDAAYGALSKLDRRSFEALSSGTLARMLGLEERVRAVARLSKLEGDVHAELGDRSSSRMAYLRALELFREAENVRANPDDRSLIEELELRLDSLRPRA